MVMALMLPASRKDESKPLMVMFVSCALMQGEANVDWVAVWLPSVTVCEGVRFVRVKRERRPYS
jgi:hypothetical protein